MFDFLQSSKLDNVPRSARCLANKNRERERESKVNEKSRPTRDLISNPK